MTLECKLRQDALKDARGKKRAAKRSGAILEEETEGEAVVEGNGGVSEEAGDNHLAISLNRAAV